jgi:hypothetical protein
VSARGRPGVAPIPPKVDALRLADWRRLSPNTRMRITLWRHAQPQPGRCHWCGCPTVLVSAWPRGAGELPENAATIDHLYPQGDPRRSPASGAADLVLACHACNGERAREDRAVLATMREAGVRVVVEVTSVERQRELRWEEDRRRARDEVCRAIELIRAGAAVDVVLVPKAAELLRYQKGVANDMRLRAKRIGPPDDRRLRVWPGRNFWTVTASQAAPAEGWGG